MHGPTSLPPRLSLVVFFQRVIFGTPILEDILRPKDLLDPFSTGAFISFFAAHEEIVLREGIDCFCEMGKRLSRVLAHCNHFPVTISQHFSPLDGQRIIRSWFHLFNVVVPSLLLHLWIKGSGSFCLCTLCSTCNTFFVCCRIAHLYPRFC